MIAGFNWAQLDALYGEDGWVDVTDRESTHMTDLAFDRINVGQPKRLAAAMLSLHFTTPEHSTPWPLHLSWYVAPRYGKLVVRLVC